MMSTRNKTLKRLSVGGLPLIHAIAQRWQLRTLLGEAIPAHGNESIPAADTLVLLIYNQGAGLISLKLYPEQRPAEHPTTRKVLAAFEDLSTDPIRAGARIVEHYRDELNDTQQTILRLLEISQHQFWAYNGARKK